jgi:hypothetical protein
MCYFVTIGISTKRVDLLHKLETNGFAVNPSGNSSLRQIFPQSAAMFEVTKGWCSCSIYQAPKASDTEHVREKYRRKGWSAAKIERALASKEHSMNNHLASGDRAAFINTIAAIASECSPIYLFAHMYSGSIVEEVINCEGKGKLAVSEILSNGGAFLVDHLVSLRHCK